MKKPSMTHQSGFTIVELMIATLVFSVILVVMTMGVLHVTHDYYKGLTLNDTQNAARTISDDISQAIQFSGGQVNWPTLAQVKAGTPNYSGRGCIGTQAYDFQLGKQLERSPSSADQQANVLQLATNQATCRQPGSAAGVPALFALNGTELLGQHMRLTTLNVQPTGDPSSHLYTVAVTVAYGDYDLLCSPADNGHDGGCLPGNAAMDPGSVSPTTFQQFITSPDLRCRQQTGSQFCAVSALQTTVQQRLVPAT